MIQIRSYAETDAPALLELFFTTVHRINSRDYSQAQIAAWAPETLDRSLWSAHMNKLNPFIAEIDGIIVGYSDLQDSGLIDHFFCHYQYQRRGVGSALMNHIFLLGKQRSITRLYSEVSLTARPFYERHGFSIVKQQSANIRGETLGNFLMEKKMNTAIR